MKFKAVVAMATAALVFAACSGGNSGSPLPQTTLPTGATVPVSGADAATGSVRVGNADHNAAASAKHFGYHIFPVQTTKPKRFTNVVRPNTDYPMDLSYHGGQEVVSAQQHALYVNCTQGIAACWGAPMAFLTDLNASFANKSYGYFGHVLDQYTGASQNNRFPVGNSVNITSQIYKDGYGFQELNENDIMAILHAGVQFLIKQGTVPNNPGYAHMFHIFLPQGVDHCFDFGGCYSPEIPSQFAFCAYHGSTDFGDIGHVVFSVEPYQDVRGCASDPSITGASIGVLPDSTDSTLSHEFFEAVSDPDPTIYPAWYNNFTGWEMADICDGWVFKLVQGGRPYQIQTEYSNASHGCEP